MPVGSAVLSAGDVEPVVLAVGGFEDELVEVGVVLDKVHPAFCLVEVGVPLVILPVGVGRKRQFQISGFAKGVLRGVGSAYLHVELVAAVAAGDNDGPSNEGAKWFQHFLAELLQSGDVL